MCTVSATLRNIGLTPTDETKQALRTYAQRDCQKYKSLPIMVVHVLVIIGPRPKSRHAKRVRTCSERACKLDECLEARMRLHPIC